MTGIAEAKWLASLAPPREAVRSGRPSAAAARSSTGATAVLGVHPRPAADQLGVQLGAADLGRDRGEHALDRVELVGAAVAEQLAAAGHDVERLAGVEDRRDGGQAVGAGGVVAGGDGLGGGGERQQRVAPAVGRRAGVGGAAAGGHAHRPRRLAAHDHGVLARRRSARRPRSTGTRRSRRSGRRARGRPSATPRRTRAAARPRAVGLGALGERAHDADREHVAALHVDRPRADELAALAVQRPVAVVRDHGVHVARAAAGAWSPCRRAWPAGPARARARSTGSARSRPRRAAARRTRRRTRRRPGRRPTARRRPPAPRARARRGGRSPRPRTAPRGP